MPTAEEIAAFIVTAKRVPARPYQDIVWEGPTRTFGETDIARWNAAVEVGAVVVGRLRLIVNREIRRNWNLILNLENEQVFAWHFLVGGRHTNQKNCPPEFPRQVRSHAQEHRWAEECDLKCCIRLDGYETASLEECLKAFCEKLHITFEPIYRNPPSGGQTLLFEGHQ